MALTETAVTLKDIRTGKADMEHRHFATIAAIIRNCDKGLIPCSTNATRQFMAELFADELADTNPKFNRARFIRAAVE